MLSKYKAMQLKANSAQESIDKQERMERDMKAKNLELADMIRERDRARYEVDRLKSVRSALLVSSDIGLANMRTEPEGGARAATTRSPLRRGTGGGRDEVEEL